MVNGGPGRQGRPWRRLTAELRSLGLPCSICGKPIDYNLPPNHRDGFTVDHRVPLSKAPWLANDRANLRAAHRSCNSSEGAKARPRPRTPRLPTSRQW
ncbi:MAG: HNH endonuclease [Actinobacteria bacterium]|nr:HNH endonuclease [Actinomycetota bacterium]